MPLHNIQSGEAGTKFVLKKMSELANKSTQNPDIIEFTSKVVETAPERNQKEEAKRIFLFVRDHIRYIKDPYRVETLFSPEAILGLEKDTKDNSWVLKGRRQADCDGKSTLAAAMLQSIGLPTRFVAIKTPQQPKMFTHVYVETRIGNRWYAADTITKKPFGWSYPWIVEKLYVDNATGKMKREPGAIGSIGEPFLVMEGISKMVTEFDRVEEVDLQGIRESLSGWIKNPIAVIGLVIFAIFGIKTLFKIT